MELKVKSTAGCFLWLLSSAFISTPICEGGAISSGGGFIYETEANPWFMENTKEVPYCVEVDPTAFKLNQERVEQIVVKALDNWKNVFRDLDHNRFQPGASDLVGRVRLATQTFIRETCGPSTALRFQFGRLSPPQRLYIPDTTFVIAQTVRTSYDEVNMRGSGFIYISADKGPLKPSSPLIDENRWIFNNGIILYRVLAHELGHMFGLQHRGGKDALMGTMHPEVISRKSTTADLATQDTHEVQRVLENLNVLSVQVPFTDANCLPESINGLPVLHDIPDLKKQFFNMPQDWHCYRLDFEHNHFTVYGSPHKGDPWEYLGETDVANQSQEISLELISIQLPAQQRVFSKLPPDSRASGYLPGLSAITRHKFQAPYRSAASPSAPSWLNVTLLPDHGYEMEGVVNGRIEVFQINASE